jgi:hypothetical protein
MKAAGYGSWSATIIWCGKKTPLLNVYITKCICTYTLVERSIGTVYKIIHKHATINVATILPANSTRIRSVTKELK